MRSTTEDKPYGIAKCCVNCTATQEYRERRYYYLDIMSRLDINNLSSETVQNYINGTIHCFVKDGYHIIKVIDAMRFVFEKDWIDGEGTTINWDEATI